MVYIVHDTSGYKMSVHEEASSQQSCAQVEAKRRHNVTATFTLKKICLLLGTGAVFLLTMKFESSRLTTFLWYTSGLGLIWLLYDMVAHASVGWCTEQILRRSFQAAHYLVRLLFLDLWNSRPKKK
ncbi:Hypothetical predicted protein [Paramuricea clavata]|uniref:Uncharacterized protein n=1 Tax=Paramuricea clavata TaxID=317549 RepID=A0A7D9DYQ5_PARCT|nr:Hypothetical predicted protein [Paramuricea clavata]